MSFILDALRKSEHERQRQSGPAIADLRTAAHTGLHPVWMVAIVALLVINLAVVLTLVLRNSDEQTTVAQTPSMPAPLPPAAAPAPQPAALPLQTAPAYESVAPLAHEETVADVSEPMNHAALSERVNSVIASDPELNGATPNQNATTRPSNETLPSYAELAARASSKIPELHLDIHVYGKQAAERFVFINMRKYREGGKTAEGTQVERITQDGVILNHFGTRFVLQRP